MKLDKVFYGFNKNGEIKLLCKRFVTEMTSVGDVVRTMYYDLEENKYIEPNDIDLESLRTISSLVGPVKRMAKRKVVKIYKADSNILYDIQRVFYGNVVKKTSIYDLKTQNGYYAGGGKNLYDDVSLNEVQNVLFVQVDGSNDIVKSLKSGEKYYLHNRVYNGMCVEEVRQINKEYFDTNLIPKKKLLELDYKKKL